MCRYCDRKRHGDHGHRILPVRAPARVLATIPLSDERTAVTTRQYKVG